jgi:hypothetical protein
MPSTKSRPGKPVLIAIQVSPLFIERNTPARSVPAKMCPEAFTARVRILRACLKRLLQAMRFRSWSLTFNLPNATTHFQAMSFRSWSLTFNLAKAGSQAPRAQARGLRKCQGVVVVGHQSSTTRSSAWPDHFSDTLLVNRVPGRISLPSCPLIATEVFTPYLSRSSRWN